ncbi:tryptophan synthase subunit alpha [Clostridium aminobutyricum]|uniref:Tryptophan synthase alpha chain n=1 Tax=Clostridium aminobutyricum TaxID=33953 RepID=A0A939D872_CLOAM|nr:tryptophan synthase subunit alpha [Clostridium aminobutyricum]MBN7772880.1 tryptophan synthase subunit alpha [Clostridium aminobutyricum]
MSKIQRAFAHKEGKGKAFIGFLTAGDPTIEQSKDFILEMERAGADLIEIGIPFSDPIAEGPVIQEANIRALSAGANTDKVFDLVALVRKESDIPLVFLTYLNPIFSYGYEKFFEKCKAVGVDGMIIPDLPFEERGEMTELAKQQGIDIISLIAPTSEERIKMIAKESTGFVYIVSSMGVTGMRSEIKTDLTAILNAVKEATDTPCAVGFGINTPDQAKAISKDADGVIVGSAIVKIIEKYGADAGPHLYHYVREMKEACK